MDLFESFLNDVRKAASAPGPAIKSLDRTYGVEFELCFDQAKFTQYLKTQLHKNDEQVYQVFKWFRYGYQEEANSILAEAGLAGWDCHGDSSVRPNKDGDISTEIVSPILQGTEGLRKIAAFLEFAKAAGGYVNSTCGGHVHVGAADLLEGSEKQVANRIVLGMLTAKKFKPLLDMFISQDRKQTSDQWASHYQRDQSEEASSVMGQMTDNPASRYSITRVINTMQHDRYKSINFQNLYGGKKTIEFRIFEGSLDFSKIVERVKFAILFVNALNKSEFDLIEKIKQQSIKPKSLGARGRKTNAIKIAEENMRDLNHRTRNTCLSDLAPFGRNKKTISFYFTMMKSLADKSFDKPMPLLGKTATVTIRDKNVLDEIKYIINERELQQSFTIQGNKVTMPFVSQTEFYKEKLQKLLSTVDLSNDGINPKQFFDMMKDAEDRPLKRKLERVKAA